MAGDALPERDAPVDLTVARLTARRAFDLLEPDHTLDGWWDYYVSIFERWWEHGIMCACDLDALRYELEDCQGANEKGVLYIEALKLSFSAFVLARENPHFAFGQHADIDTLARKALDLVIAARPLNGPARITFDLAASQRLATRQERMWLSDLIDRAEVPIDA